MDKLIQTLNGLKPAIAKQMTFVQDATRETVDYVRTGAVDAHRDVGQRREEDRKVDPYGQPARPNVVYGIVKRAEQELGLGKGKSKAKGATGAGDAGNGHGSSAVSGNGDVESGEITYVPHTDNSQLAQPSSSNTGVTMPGNTATQNLPHQSSFSTATQPAPPLPARPSEPASYVPPIPRRPQDHLPPSYTTVAQPSNYRDARDDVKNDTDSHPAFKATPERTDCISTSRPRSSSSASDSSLTLIPLGPGEFYVDLVPEQPPHEQGPMFGPAPETNRERANRYVKVVDDVTDEIAMGIAMGFLLGPDISMILDIIDAASGKDVKQVSRTSLWIAQFGKAVSVLGSIGYMPRDELTFRLGKNTKRQIKKRASISNEKRDRLPRWPLLKRRLRMPNDPNSDHRQSRIQTAPRLQILTPLEMQSYHLLKHDSTRSKSRV